MIYYVIWRFLKVKVWWCVWMFESIMGFGRSFKIFIIDGVSVLEWIREDICFYFDIMVEIIFF